MTFLSLFALVSTFAAHHSLLCLKRWGHLRDRPMYAGCWLSVSPHSLSSNTCTLVPTCRFARSHSCPGHSDLCIILYTLAIHTPGRTSLDPVSFWSPFPLPSHCSLLPEVKKSWAQRGQLPLSVHHPPPQPWVLLSTRQVSVGKEKQEQPFQRKQPLRPNCREIRGRISSVQFYNLGWCIAVLLSVRGCCLSLSFSLFQSLSPFLCWLK